MTDRAGLRDATVVGSGAALLIAGFLPWWRAEVTAGGVALGPARGHTAWDVSVAWWLPVLAGTVTGGLWLLRRLDQLAPPWLPGVTALVGVVGLGLVVGRWLTLDPSTGGDYGWYAYAPAIAQGSPLVRGTPGVGLWIAGAALAAQAAMAGSALRRRRATPGSAEAADR